MSKKRITIPIFIPHSGCPHVCVFCNQWSVSGVHSIPGSDIIRSTVDLYLSTKPETVDHVEVAFFGGSFTGIDMEVQQRLLESVQVFIDKGEIHSIRISTRPDYI